MTRSAPVVERTSQVRRIGRLQEPRPAPVAQNFCSLSSPRGRSIATR
jgi:hypothetical protein